MSVAALAGRIHPRAVAGWLMARELDPQLRAALMATLIQRRPAVFISCAALLMMSAAAAWLVAEPWAYAWLALDLLLLGYRLHLSFLYDRGGDGPTEGHCQVVASMFLVFMLFGLGCAISIASGNDSWSEKMSVLVCGSTRLRW